MGYLMWWGNEARRTDYSKHIERNLAVLLIRLRPPMGPLEEWNYGIAYLIGS